MTETNRVRMAVVREVTPGTTPGSARMRTARFTSEGLKYTPQFTTSNEIRSDRMNSDPSKVGEDSNGPFSFELSYPVPNTFISEMIVNAMWNDWVNTPTRDNDGTADSVITDVVAASQTVTVTTGTAYAIGHLVRHTNFTNAANNGLFRVTTGGATSYISAGSAMVNETAPPGTARSKVVGFAGAAGDITATATGLGSTALNFTTLGLTVGQAIKIGGTATANKFATAALNDWARITAISATALTLDNLPTGWTTDSGSGKLIWCFFGDTIKNGVTKYAHSNERAFLGQAAPTYIIARGMQVNTLSFDISSKKEITCSVETISMASAQGTSAYGTTYDAAPTNAVMAGSANVGRIAENGSRITNPNWAQSLRITLNNNLRSYDSVDEVGVVNIAPGSCDVGAEMNTYFGDNVLYTKLIAGTISSINGRPQKNSQALVFQLPRLTATDGAPNASGKNADAMLPLTYQASIDPLTNAHILIDRVEYYE